MHTVIVLIICLFIFLYCVFVLAKDDFLLLRKNVTLEQLFNVSFLGFIFGLFMSRLVFVLEHAKGEYLNPLVFFLFPYFPGLSVTGGVFGATLTLWLYAQRKRLPFARILDIFSLSFFYAWVVGEVFAFLGTIFITRHIILLLLPVTAVFFVLAVVFTLLFVRGRLKDGNTGQIGFAVFSVVEFFSRMLMRGPKNYSSFMFEDILLIFLFLGFLAMYIQQETLGGFYKSMRKR
ncbi:MAG: prolipoprotein diacylglyceryl transferase [Patescibacteria group bacterium]|nr:prolipoprotein diacylglyceryl transferase [Patescibacteria group bacterium]MDE2590862.1 prolipoprotein diacylglyceryl transferase [Patescibacteria group bacterium]